MDCLWVCCSLITGVCAEKEQRLAICFTAVSFHEGDVCSQRDKAGCATAYHELPYDTQRAIQARSVFVKRSKTGKKCVKSSKACQKLPTVDQCCHCRVLLPFYFALNSCIFSLMFLFFQLCSISRCKCNMIHVIAFIHCR